MTTPGRALTAIVAAAAIAAVGAVVARAATSTPNDQFFVEGDQWPLTGAAASINAPLSWCRTTGAGMVIAELSTGADFRHPDLAGKLTAGAAFISGAGDSQHPDATGQGAVQDDAGAGTNAAGVMVAATNNGRGIAAVAPDARALVVRVLNRSLSGHAVDIAAGIRYAQSGGARVVYLELGRGVALDGDHRVILDAIHAAAAAGAGVALPSDGPFVTGLDSSELQGLGHDALVTGPLGPDGGVASYSQASLRANIWAPGGDSQRGASSDAHHLVTTTALLTANPQGYDLVEGSYLAAAHAAGALAEVMALGGDGAAARHRLIGLATTRNGRPELNLGAALGATQPCPSRGAAPPGAGSAGRPGAGALATVPRNPPVPEEDAGAPDRDTGAGLTVNRSSAPAARSRVPIAATAAVAVAVAMACAGLVYRRRRRQSTVAMSAEARRELKRW
ncbi:MAG: S8 family serine peptidase [Candidatus Dormibacteria bacterium]